jgi:hypothetical protein
MKATHPPGGKPQIAQEIGRFFREEHRIIVPLTVREIPEEEIARKLA